MADIFWDGFDKYTSAANVLAGEWTSFLIQANQPEFALVPGRFGGQSIIMWSNTSSANGALARTLPNSYATLIMGCAFQSQLASGVSGFTFTDGTTDQFSLSVNTLGQLQVWRGSMGSGTLLGTSIQTVSVNTWNYIEVQVTINNSTGAYSVYLNNALTSLNATSQNTRVSTNNSANNFKLISAGYTNVAANTSQFDDLYLFDNTGGTNNAIRGDSRVETGFPISDTATIAFTLGQGNLGVVATTDYYNGVGGTYQGNQHTIVGTANMLFLRKYTPLVNGTINSIGIIPATSSAPANFKGVIYSDSSNTPNTLLSSGTQVTGAVVSTTLTMPLVTPQSLTAGTPVWIGFITDTAVTFFTQDGNAPTTGSTFLGSQANNTYASGAPGTAPAMTGGKESMILYGNVTGIATNFSQVNEPLPGQITSYLTSATVSAEDLYNFGALSSTPVTIAGMKLSAMVQKTDSGVRTIDLRTKSTGTESGGSNTGFSPSQTWGYVATYFDTDPHTGSAWTATNLAAATSGIKIDT